MDEDEADEEFTAEEAEALLALKTKLAKLRAGL